jgi:hypothetical protein
MYKEIFVESFRGGYGIDLLTKNELKFMISKDLIDVRNSVFYPKFVGEIITPENSYFSLPKNFTKSKGNVELFKQVLQNYKNLKGEDGKTLLTNNHFSIDDRGEFFSEKFFYNELKEYFLDYITYEFIYPKKTIKKHSTTPTPGGKVDVVSTMRNIKSKGPGITYDTKDFSKNPDWTIDDIYWSTLSQLSKKYSSSDDIEQISEMKDFLTEEGFVLNQIDISDYGKMIRLLKNSEVNIIHQPIKNTLIDFFESKNIKEVFKINVFYTIKFQYVWEELVRECLNDSEDFRESLKSKFYRKQQMTKSFRSEEEANNFIKENKCVGTKLEKIGSFWILNYEIDVRSLPDLFSTYDGKKFIGDAKYYSDPENSEFDKEFSTYNRLIDNKYPMVVFIPSTSTRLINLRRELPLELIVCRISTKEAISDVVNGTEETLRKVYMLINKYTSRKGKDFLGGF